MVIVALNNRIQRKLVCGVIFWLETACRILILKLLVAVIIITGYFLHSECSRNAHINQSMRFGLVGFSSNSGSSIPGSFVF